MAILTSGGDAPGMNACIRSIVRCGNNSGLNIFGIKRGYKGLIANEFEEFNSRRVSNIIQKGGTVLKTARSDEFMKREGLEKAAENLNKNKIDGLIVIGGDGTYHGAFELLKVWKGQIIGVPGTIDNDLSGTDNTIGYDTAVNTAVDAIDKIRDTADSHDRFFIVEVMGRDSGFIALDVGISGGAEEVLIPETQTNIKRICDDLCLGKKRGKSSSILIVSEGDESGGAYQLSERLKEKSGNEYRVVVLGHLQRGGNPTAADRILATELGAFSIQQMIEGKSGVAVGKVKGSLVMAKFEETWTHKKRLNPFLLELLPILAT